MNIRPYCLICPPTAHTTHRMLLQVSLYTCLWHQPALLMLATWGQGGGQGNKFIISFPSSPYPISFPVVNWPKDLAPNPCLKHHCLKFPSLSHVASEAREQILLEMSKARETADWPEIHTLYKPMDQGPPGSSVQGILQARILQWIAMPSSREPSQPRDWTQVS